jgi:hypothetical protein
VLKAVSNHPGVIHAGFLVERLLWVVLAHDDSEFTGGIQKDLISAYSKDRFERNGFTMPG